MNIQISDADFKRILKKLNDLTVRADRCSNCLFKADENELNMTALAADSLNSMSIDLGNLVEIFDKLRGTPN